jgi:leucyl aminopeptidase
MMQYDMTAWVRNGTDEAIGVISSDVDLGLMVLHVQLVNAYSDLPAVVFRLFEGAGSDQ